MAYEELKKIMTFDQTTGRGGYSVASMICLKFFSSTTQSYSIEDQGFSEA
jgi:hypothetical protein